MDFSFVSYVSFVPYVPFLFPIAFPLPHPYTNGMNLLPVSILPSLLAADPGALAEGCRRAEAAGADEIHIDIMDAHFVPNLSFSPAIVAMAKRAAPNLPRNVHLMMTHPHEYAERFIEAGATTILIHVEPEYGILATLAAIRARGVRCGLVLNPETPARAVFPYLNEVDEILCMTVRPGRGGQSFMPEVLPTIGAVRRAADGAGNANLTLMVDGGINLETATLCTAAGANAFVAGTFLYAMDDMAAGVRALRKATKK